MTDQTYEPATIEPCTYASTDPRFVAAQHATDLVASGQLDPVFWLEHAERALTFLEGAATPTPEPPRVFERVFTAPAPTVAQNATELGGLVSAMQSDGFAVLEDADGDPVVVLRGESGLRLYPVAANRMITGPVLSKLLEYPVRVILSRRGRGASDDVSEPIA